LFKTSDTSLVTSDVHAPAGSDLDDLARLAIEIGAADVAAEADAVARRVAEGRFYVACVGQFKRGKSALLNALVRPIEETEARIEALANATADAERSMADLGYLLAAEVDRLSARFTADREAFLFAAHAEAGRELASALEGLRSGSAREWRTRARESARRLEFEIRARLSEAVRSATSALERAKARRAEGDASVAAELRRLGEWRLRAQQIGGTG
jgi:hypothetical protein